MSTLTAVTARFPELAYRLRVPSFRRSTEPVLGTRLTLRVDAADEQMAEVTFAAVLAEADRLEAALSAYRPESAFAAWRRGELVDPGPDVVAVLALAAHWHEKTSGAFSPRLGALMRRWARAEREQRVPSAEEMADLASHASRLPFVVDDSRVFAIGDCRDVDVHGVAKGWVIDRMVGAALRTAGVAGVVVDVGGDLRHAARDVASRATVAIEDPFALADNAPPLTVVTIANRAVATSGGGRRGWNVAGRWYGHLLDPRSGWPLATPRSATVVASTAADADALASAAAVVGEQISTIEPACAALVVDEQGEVWRSDSWANSVDEL
ncbi:MAG: FAD:protein FMN transferase [Acidimicrobiales bacterium]